MTTRVWKRSLYTTLSSKYMEGVVPAKTNYGSEDTFGHLFVWKLWPRRIDSLTEQELRWEATGSTDWKHFAKEYCAEGTDLHNQEYKDEDGNDMVVFSMRYIFLPLGMELAIDLRACWTLSQPWGQPRDCSTCGVCSLPFHEKSGKELCSHCGHRIHMFDCGITVSSEDDSPLVCYACEVAADRAALLLPATPPDVPAPPPTELPQSTPTTDGPLSDVIQPPAGTEADPCKASWLKLVQLQQNKMAAGKSKPWRAKMEPQDAVLIPASLKGLGGKGTGASTKGSLVHAFFGAAMAFTNAKGKAVTLFPGARLAPGEKGHVCVMLYVPKPGPDIVYCLTQVPGEEGFTSVRARDITIPDDCELLPALDSISEKKEAFLTASKENKVKWLDFIREEHKDLAEVVPDETDDGPCTPTPGETNSTSEVQVDKRKGNPRTRKTVEKYSPTKFNPNPTKKPKANGPPPRLTSLVDSNSETDSDYEEKGKGKGKGRRARPRGERGLQGPQGPQGSQGPTGKAGERAAQGPPGKDASQTKTHDDFMALLKETNRHAEEMARIRSGQPEKESGCAQPAVGQPVLGSLFSKENIEALKLLKSLFTS